MKRLKPSKTIEETAKEGTGNIQNIVNSARGYQPPRATSKPPAPPTSGSNAVKPKNN